MHTASPHAPSLARRPRRRVAALVVVGLAVVTGLAGASPASAQTSKSKTSAKTFILESKPFRSI